MAIHPRAGQAATPADLVDVGKLLAAYVDLHPDPSDPAQRVAFGTSGHRGSALHAAFNEDHIARDDPGDLRVPGRRRVDGPLYLARDSHALSEPAFATALEVLAGNGVTVRVDSRDRLTPTPALSHAVLTHNARRAGARPTASW